MPWSIVQNHSECPSDRPWAVVKDSDGSVNGCHSSRESAEEQVAALYASEEDNESGAIIVARGVLDDGGEGDDADRRRDLIRQIELGNFNAFSVEAAGVDVEENCAATNEEGGCERFRLTFSRYRIGAASVVTIPAIEGTLIELDPPNDNDEGRGFSAIIAREGVETDEGMLTRAFPAECFEWGDGPWTITAHHDDYLILGRMTGIERCPLVVATASLMVPDELSFAADEGFATQLADTMSRPLLASGAPADTVVPAAWLDEPEDLPDLDESGSRVPVITDDGRVYGWLASWTDCHTSFADYCQTPWRSPSGYAYAMHSGPFLTDDGQRVTLAPLAASGGHYPTDRAHAANWQAAQRHYDDPNTCAAYVAFGENDRGIWFSGLARPDAPETLLNLLRRHQLSGDWRRPFGEWELMGACSVNQPGFVRRAAWAASAEGELELVAAVVSSAAGAAVTAACSCGGTCASCATHEPEAEHEDLAGGVLAQMQAMVAEVRLLVDDIHGGDLAASGATGLPLAARERAWDASAAVGRMRKLASSDDSGDPDTINWTRYGRGFFWHADNPKALGDFKLPFADVINGRLTAVPRGVFAAAAVMQGSRGGASIPEADRDAVRSRIAGYYHKFGDKAPWEKESQADSIEVRLSALEAQLRLYADVLEPTVRDILRNRLT